MNEDFLAGIAFLINVLMIIFVIHMCSVNYEEGKEFYNVNITKGTKQ